MECWSRFIPFCIINTTTKTQTNKSNPVDVDAFYFEWKNDDWQATYQYIVLNKSQRTQTNVHKIVWRLLSTFFKYAHHQTHVLLYCCRCFRSFRLFIRFVCLPCDCCLYSLYRVIMTIYSIPCLNNVLCQKHEIQIFTFTFRLFCGKLVGSFTIILFRIAYRLNYIMHIGLYGDIHSSMVMGIVNFHDLWMTNHSFSRMYWTTTKTQNTYLVLF